MTTKKDEVNIFNLKENDDCPMMLQVYSDSTYQEVLCFAVAYETPVNARPYDSDKLLMAVIAGADSAMQSVKASIEVGSQGIRFGQAEKGLANFNFKSLKTLGAEKGKYIKTNIPLQHVRNAMAFVHEDIANNSKYVLSFDGDPAHEIANLLGGALYGLHILPEWEQVVFDELSKHNYIKEHKLYFDKELFPALQLFSIDLTEEQADAFISDIIKRGLISFPMSGTGEELEKIDSLSDYIIQYTEDMAKKLQREIKPIHDPNVMPALECFDKYKRTLFPVQAHTSTAVAKLLLQQKAAIIQGEPSSGKSTMLVATVDGHAQMTNKKGFFSALICPPSLTAKWPKEIKSVMPNAEVHVIRKTDEFISFHQAWNNAGRPKPTKPTFFIFSFTTLRNDAANRPAVDFKAITTDKQRKENKASYRKGYYCSSCGKAHQVVVSTRTEIQNDREVEIDDTRDMKETEFGATRRLHKNTANPPNAFCYHCGESLWSRKIERRYSKFSEWATQHEKRLMPAILSGDTHSYERIQEEQPNFATSTSQPRRVAAVEYIRRKARKMFDYLIVDEVHERVNCFL